MIRDKPPEGWDDAPAKPSGGPPPGWDSAAPVDAPVLTDYAKENRQGPFVEPTKAERVARVRGEAGLDGDIDSSKPPTYEKVSAELAKPINAGLSQEDIVGGATFDADREKSLEPAKDFAKFAAGGVAGEAIGAVAGPIMRSASGRVATRVVKDIATGAKEKARIALGEVGESANAVIKRHLPDFLAAKNPAELKGVLARLQKEKGELRDIPFNTADQNAVRSVHEGKLEPLTPGAPKITAPASTKPIPDEASDFDAINTASGRTESPTVVTGKRLPPPNLTKKTPPVDSAGPVTKEHRAPAINDFGATSESVGPMQAAGKPEPERVLGKGHGAGGDVKSITDRWDSKIARYKNGTNTEKDIAKAMENERAKFLEGRDAEGVMPAKEMRKNASSFQTAYDKTASNASNEAQREMSKDTLDALRSHLKDPKLIKEVDDLTEELSALKRMSNANKQKLAKSLDPAPREPIAKEKAPLWKRIAKSPATTTAPARHAIDRVLARLAHAKVTGADVGEIAAKAIQLGVSQDDIDDILAKADKVKR